MEEKEDYWTSLSYNQQLLAVGSGTLAKLIFRNQEDTEA